MKQNEWLIKQMKEIEEQKKLLREKTRDIVPELYACFCKILIDEYHNSVEEVETLFARTQELWNELCTKDEMKGMIEWCEETTGIVLQSGDDDEYKTKGEG